MGYGRLSDEQQRLVKGVVAGKVIYDLGAGDGELARLLVRLGAARVIAVDKHKWPDDDGRIERRCCRFTELNNDIEMIFLSWPDNHPLDGLLRLVKHAKTVAYVGKNTDGSACGWPALLTEFSQRAILHHLPERKNTLTIYSDQRVKRQMTGEEYAGIYVHGEWFTFEQAEKLAGAPV